MRFYGDLLTSDGNPAASPLPRGQEAPATQVGAASACPPLQRREAHTASHPSECHCSRSSICDVHASCRSRSVLVCTKLMTCQLGREARSGHDGGEATWAGAAGV